MVLVKQLSRGAWLHSGRVSKDPDKEALKFGLSGEFSPWLDIAFNKHLKRLEKISKYFAHLNSKRIRAIVRAEKPWYALEVR